MPIPLACPNCRQPIPIAADFADHSFTCPACGTSAAVPADFKPKLEIGISAPSTLDGIQATPPPIGIAGSEPASSKPWTEPVDSPFGAAEAWRTVRHGMRFLKISVLISLGSYVTVFGATIYLATATGPDPFSRNALRSGLGSDGARVVLSLLAIGLLLALFVGMVLKVIGSVRCLQVPPQAGAGGMALGALICAIVSIVLTVVGFVAALFFPIANGIVGLVDMNVQLAAISFVLLFLNRIGTVLGSEVLCRRVVRFAISLGAWIVCLMILFAAFIGIVTSTVGSSGSPTAVLDWKIIEAMAPAILMAAMGAVAVLILFKYQRLLQLAIDEVDTRAVEQERPA